jgi:hypothetical protein
MSASETVCLVRYQGARARWAARSAAGDRLARYGLLPAGQPANLLPGRGSVAYQLEGACRESIAARRHAPRRSPSRAALAVFQAALHLAEPCAAAT